MRRECGAHDLGDFGNLGHCGRPAVDFVEIKYPGGTAAIWLCAEHYDSWGFERAPRGADGRGSR